MTEIKKTVNDSNLYNNSNYKTLYMWMFYRLPAIKLLNIAVLVLLAYMFFQVIAISLKFGPLYKEILLLFLFAVYMFILLPNLKFYLNRKNILKKYGNEYEMIFNEKGIKTC